MGAAQKLKDDIELFGVAVGSHVHHYRDADLTGFVVQLDSEHAIGGVTTCRVVWEAESYEDALLAHREHQDVQWTNKLRLVECE